jgi:superfamily II DNA or RNA helicase
MKERLQYSEFLETKTVRFESSGITDALIRGPLYPFQQKITQWALAKGRACIFADCGLGKTIMQLEWAEHVAAESGPVIILTPLAVAAQTEREAIRFGYTARRAERPEDATSPIVITNYEKMDRFDMDEFAGVVLDESSILKSFVGKNRNEIITRFASHRFKLACSATPAPNDYMELGNHSEFVGAMTRTEMLAMYFIHDGGETQKWRIKGHAGGEFWQWVTSWAAMISKPSDLGCSDEGFELPPLRFDTHNVDSGFRHEGMLFDVGSPSIHERRAARRASIDQRCQLAADMANGKPDQWIIWCDLNDESSALAKMIPDSVEIRGSDTSTHKRDSMIGFADGDIRVLVTKPKIAGFGMNWQGCHHMAFVGLSDSYEALYQATRRCWRFGQVEPVDVHIITSSGEGAVLKNVLRKERDHKEMQRRMAIIMSEHSELGGGKAHVSAHVSGEAAQGIGWELIHGDCVEAMSAIPDDSVGYSIFSPPFASLYTYSDSPRDMGNCVDDGEFFEHFRYIGRELARVVQPGRLISFHCMTLPTSKVRDGVIGLKDLRGDLIRVFQESGWIYHSEVCIWKDPVTAMQRTKALGLLHKTIRKDSSMSRQGVPDYVVTMRNPGENTTLIAHDASDFPVSLWQKWASPIWMDINPNDTLQFRSAREDDDERHICPLQLEVIRRCIGLWSNPDDLIMSPFAGIGSEGVEAIKWGRRYIGIELKRSYWDLAVRNLRESELESNQLGLFV